MDSGPAISSSFGTVGSVSVIEAPAGGARGLVAGQGGGFSAAAKVASAAVVSISTSKAATKNPHAGDPWFKFFYGDQGREEPQGGLGSGVIISPEGYILTNNHVVEGADEIEVILLDSRKTKAKVIGTDPDTDLAILKIDLDKLPVIVLGNSDSLQVGDQVLAIGNPFGVGQTVTGGIVSALGRNKLGINTFENFLQTIHQKFPFEIRFKINPGIVTHLISLSIRKLIKFHDLFSKVNRIFCFSYQTCFRVIYYFASFAI